MPEMRFLVRWPDGGETTYWSPSLVVHDHLEAGHTYPLPEFVARAVAALDIASERVQARYGFACTSAMAEQDAIRLRAAAFDDRPGGTVDVLEMHPPLPVVAS